MTTKLKGRFSLEEELGKAMVRHRERLLTQQEQSLAESKSLCSDPSMQFFLNSLWPTTSTEVYAAWVALFLLVPGTGDWDLLEPWAERFLKKAVKHELRGDWKVLKNAVLQRRPSLRAYLDCYLEEHSPQELYGNLFPLILRAMGAWRLGVKNEPSAVEDHRPVKRTVRRRGYKDKGSTRPSYQMGRNLPDPDFDEAEYSRLRFILDVEWITKTPSGAFRWRRFRRR